VKAQEAERLHALIESVDVALDAISSYLGSLETKAKAKRLAQVLDGISESCKAAKKTKTKTKAAK
jgi:hypothetical protein